MSRRKTLPSKAATEENNVSEEKKASRRSLPSKAVSPTEKVSVTAVSEEPILNIEVETEVEVKKLKGKKKQKLTEDDEPKPFVEFMKTPLPKAFARKAMKTEPRMSRKKAEQLEKRKPILSTPKTEPRKSVRIDITKNKAIGDKELQVSPLPAFHPDKKPTKGVLKTPARAVKKRSRASEYF